MTLPPATVYAMSNRFNMLIIRDKYHVCFFGTKLLIKKEGPKKISFSEFARLKRGPKIRQSGCHEEPGSIIQILAKLFKSDPEKEEVPRWVRMM